MFKGEDAEEGNGRSEPHLQFPGQGHQQLAAVTGELR